jgi:hypothetical protein
MSTASSAKKGLILTPFHAHMDLASHPKGPL